MINFSIKCCYKINFHSIMILVFQDLVMNCTRELSEGIIENSHQVFALFKSM